VEAKLAAAMAYAEASPEPDPSELETDVFAPLKTGPEAVAAEAGLRDRVRNDSNMRVITYVQALIEAQREEMKRDEHVFLMGEDIGLYGGAYGATRGLQAEIRAVASCRYADLRGHDRRRGRRAAMAGLRPVAEIMYVDFTPLAMDQIANQGAKNRYMFGGKTSVPMVLRTEGGAGRAIARAPLAEPGVVVDALPGHLRGHAVDPIRRQGAAEGRHPRRHPVMFIEHKMLYGTKGPVPEEDYIIPLGVADVKRPGKDITLVTYSRMVLRALEAAELLAKEALTSR